MKDFIIKGGGIQTYMAQCEKVDCSLNLITG